jgi:pilus assembly protein Flp/PilA
MQENRNGFSLTAGVPYAERRSLGKEVNLMFRKMQKKGQGLVEYALILVLVAIVIIIILSVLGPAIGNVFSQIINSI